MPRFRSFLALGAADRLALLEAMAELALAAVLVRGVPPRRWRARFGQTVTQDTHADISTVRRVRLAIARAHRTIPTAPNCLPQALAAKRMLARRGITTSLFLGTESDGAGVRHFHAWLKAGPEWVTGQCDEARYTVFSPPEHGSA
ncbi:lasso peptide biosynthesis B2 protein [Qipengyuania marisflavi]|uniref:Lasso peptide biosynthesis B2 protein n=1 Tax=Qipengyuania marisflavi TaxID=2486356 RepID=A0A5S3PAM5_9SPHN|nr:lasso peptide biosynthesis B2 protein [Qipengyuania marisflavi]TMM50423.1 lasso peptide biosynthesis B2 protein [Qipengyuania marisflavi]